MGDIDQSMLRTILRAMKRRNVKKIQSLCHDPSTGKAARSALYQNLREHLVAIGRSYEDASWWWRYLVKRLIDLDLVPDQLSLSELDVMFALADAESLESLLDCKIVAQVREKFGCDLRVAAFGNKRANAVSLLWKQNLDVNATSSPGWTALRWAARGGNPRWDRKVSFVLDAGADVNFCCERGRTALFEFVRQYEDVQPLLERGADVQVVDDQGLTVFDGCSQLDLLVSQLAIDYVKGIPINPIIRKQIDFDFEFTKYYKEYRRQCQTLRKRVAWETVTLFDVLTASVERLSRLVSCKERRFESAIEWYLDNHPDTYYPYYYTLKFKVGRAVKMRRFKLDIAKIISMRTGKFVGVDHLVVDKILGYPTQNDLAMFNASTQPIKK